SGERLDRDRFRRDLGGVEDACSDVLNRVMSEAGEAEAFAATFEPPEDSPFDEAEDGHHVHDHEDHDHEDHDHEDHDHDREEHGARGARGLGSFDAVVDVMLKASILDPQGRAVLQTLERLGYDTVKDVRVGKRVELKLEGDPEEVRRQVADMSAKVLSNPVMETFEVGFEDGD